MADAPFHTSGRSRRKKAETGLSAEERKRAANAIMEESEKQLLALEAGQGGPAGGAGGGKRRKVRGASGKVAGNASRLPHQEEYLKLCESRNRATSLAFDAAELLKAAGVGKVDVARAGPPAVHVCCWCCSPAQYRCRKCTRMYCSIKCRDLHMTDMCSPAGVF